MADLDTRVDELKRIFDRDGQVQASVVVKEAKPKRAPLHDEFEWDDSVAGHAFRLGQARRIIRVTPYVEKTGKRSRFVHVPVEKVESPTAVIAQKEGVYKPIKEIVKQPNELKRALQELWTQRMAMDRAFRELQSAAKQTGQELPLVEQLHDGLRIVKSTLRLMMKGAA